MKMAGLTHEQAKRFLHAAADKHLNPKERVALEAHLADCAMCRAYAAELDWLNVAIARALKSHWAAPRRSPIEMSAQVRNRMQLDAGRKFMLNFASVTLKLGSAAVVLALALGVLRGPELRASHTASAYAESGSSLRNSLPRFELDSDSEQAIFPINYTSETDRWLIPYDSPTRLDVYQY